MKIVCPECQAAYEIDIPESPTKDLSAKCAVCDSKFPIKKRSLAKTGHSHDSMEGPPLAHIDSGLIPESTDDFLSGLQEGEMDFGESHFDPEESSSEEEKNLDDYLDQLLVDEFGESEKENLDESASLVSEMPSEVEKPPALGADMPSEDDLDRLFDSLIAEEIKSPTETLEEPEQDILDESVQKPIQEAPSQDSELPSEDNLDHIFDSLLTEEMETSVANEEVADSIPSPAIDPEDTELDSGQLRCRDGYRANRRF
jgi:predicted Zn finger-like uncharacterized protein